MRLYEISTLTHDEIGAAIKKKETEEKLPFGQLVDKLRDVTNANIKELGSGNFAIVVANVQEQGTVKKIVDTVPYEDLLRDAYFRFLVLISQNERMAKNPYLPRVYSINIHQAAEGQVVYTVEMERLSPITSATTPALLAMGKRMFAGFEDAVKQKISKVEQDREEGGFEDKKDPQKRSDRYLSMIADQLDDHIEGHGELRIVDPYLRHAIAIIKQAQRHPDVRFTADIHEDNIMMRRTSFGFQLVITDPLS